MATRWSCRTTTLPADRPIAAWKAWRSRPTAALVGMMQNALLQDHGLHRSTIGRVGIYHADPQLRPEDRRDHEYVYVLDAINQGRGVNEMLAINDHEFLVLERDNRSLVPTPPKPRRRPT